MLLLYNSVTPCAWHSGIKKEFKGVRGAEWKGCLCGDPHVSSCCSEDGDVLSALTSAASPSSLAVGAPWPLGLGEQELTPRLGRGRILPKEGVLTPATGSSSFMAAWGIPGMFHVSGLGEGCHTALSF